MLRVPLLPLALLGLLALPAVSTAPRAAEPVRHRPGETADAFAERALPELDARWTRCREDAQAAAARDPLTAEWVETIEPVIGQLRDNIALDRATPAASERVISEVHDYAAMVQSVSDALVVRAGQPRRPGLVINVREYGAAGDGIADDGPILNAILRMAIARGAEQVYFPAGNYYIDRDSFFFIRDIPGEFDGDAAIRNALDAGTQQRNHAHLVIDGARDLRIVAEPGAKIVCGNLFAAAVGLGNCVNTTLENLTIEYRTPPVIEGVLEAVEDGKTIVCRMDEDFDVALFKRSPVNPMMRWHSRELDAEGRPLVYAIASHSFNSDIESLGDRRYRFTVSFPENTAFVQPGLRPVLAARGYNACVYNRSGQDVTLKNIVAHDSSTMFIQNFFSERTFLVGCRMAPRPGRFAATGADGLYFHNSSGGGLVARNDLEGLYDDYVNIHGVARPFHAAGGRTLLMPLTLWDADLPRPGRRMGFLRLSQGRVEFSDEAFIERVEIVPPGDAPGMGHYKLTFDRELPANLASMANTPAPANLDYCVFMDTLNHGLAFKENRFGPGISRLLMGGRNLIFVGNQVDERMAWPLAFIGQEVSFARGSPHDLGFEGMFPRNQLYLENAFRSGYPKMFLRIRSSLLAPAALPAPDMAHLFFRNNTFTVETPVTATPLETMAADVNDVDHFVFEGNRLSTDFRAPVAGLRLGPNLVDAEVRDNVLVGYAPEEGKRGD